MSIKDCQIDFLRWVLSNCKNSLEYAVVLENIQVKKLLDDPQDVFYLDSDNDMNKLYTYYEKDTKES